MNEHTPLQIPKGVYVERAVQGRRNDERLRTLRAIAELISLNTDVDGEASGTLTVTDIARRAHPTAFMSNSCRVRSRSQRPKLMSRNPMLNALIRLKNIDA